MPGLVTQQLPLPTVTVVVSCSRWLRAGLPLWNFWNQILKFRLFLTQLTFLKIKNTSQNLAFLFYFFHSERLGSGETLSELRIHYKSLLMGVYDHAGCKEYCKDFTVVLKIFDVFNKKQQYDSVFTGKENASKNWNCILSMFLTSFNIYFCLVMHVLCVAHVLELLSGLFWLFWDKVWLFWWIWSLVVDS